MLTLIDKIDECDKFLQGIQNFIQLPFFCAKKNNFWNMYGKVT